MKTIMKVVIIAAVVVAVLITVNYAAGAVVAFKMAAGIGSI